MSFAIHLLVQEKFSETTYIEYLGKVQNLFGTWALEEVVPFNEETRYLTIHDCWIKSDEPASFTRVNITAQRRVKDIPVWTYDYEWHLRLEKGSGRTPMSLAVQLGGWLLAMNHFRYTLALDRDSVLKNEPTEFRSIDSASEHAKRVLAEEFECSAELMRRGILNENGYLTVR